MKEKKPYFIGLDCGTSSVGWAVADENYQLLKGTHRIKKAGKTKTKKQTLWGFRLFDEAATAAKRRTSRSARRRNARAKARLKLLRMLFRDEISAVDPEFYQRLRESFYWEEDKNLQRNSKNTLFNDPGFTDKDFHQKYPTIWHLRQAIINPENANQSFDIRLYFLAIQHILKRRGHFLLDGEIGDGGVNFAEIFDEFCTEAERAGYRIANMPGEVKEILTKKAGKSDKKKTLAGLLYIEDDDSGDDEAPKGQAELAGLLVGSKVDLKKIFALDDDEKFSYSFADGVFEDKLPDIEQAIGSDNLDLIFAAKKIYDYAILHNLLGQHTMISDAMVANYDQHKADLESLKAVFKPHPETYRQLFKDNKYDKKSNKFDVSKNPSYGAYAGRAYQVEGEREGHVTVSQEDFNKYLHKLLESISDKTSPELMPKLQELLDRTDTSEKSTSPLLLPKQRGQAKGTIPQQLHGNELKFILEKLQKDFPSFAEEVSGEDEDYNTKAKKILKIHGFRIPYYCGPLVKRKFDKDGNPVPGGKSQFSWADDEISELVYPWNFDKLVDKDQRAENFIRRMTNECTYLVGEDVLPKCSLTYQKYMVLNELNNLKINGQRIDNDLKQRIFEHGYKNGELTGNITLKKLAKWCRSNGFIGSNDELSGTSEVKTLPKYQTYQDFRRILGNGFEKQYSGQKLEEAVEAITILSEEKDMLQSKLKSLLGCDDETAEKLSKLSYKDWGRMSAKFLNGITLDNRTILDYLWEDNKNLMELLGQEVGFGKVVEEYNDSQRPKNAKVGYQGVQSLYCSPAVKRSVWQTLKIVNELTQNLGYAPKKIFLEVTRGEDAKSKGKYTSTRKKDLEKIYKTIKTEDAKAILNKLEGYEDRDLQSKKLFLYFSQMGKCAYSGEPIDIEELNNSQLYDIDHIYPRSKTKDDSITRNLVLVKANLNREKTNIYPISDSIRSRMSGMWGAWLHAGLITKEKYDRLVRSAPLTNDELGGFIARQLVETSQSVKAIRDLLQRAYPETKIIMVKAGQVSDFRHLMSCDKKDRDGRVYEPGKYEFIKVRDINDLHHAKDAYLNIVVGNVMNETFTSNPYEWIKQRSGKEYSIRPERIFRASQKYQKTNGEETIYPEVRGWNFADSIKTVSDTMKRNDVIWTRMNYTRSGEISKATILGKGKSDGMLAIKQSPRMSIEKYGGFTKIQGAYFALIENYVKNGERMRQIISIPIINIKTPEKYILDRYQGARVIIPMIKYQSLLKLDSFPMHLSGKTNDSISFYPAVQCFVVNNDVARNIKAVISFVKKSKTDKNYKLKDEDRITKDDNEKTYEYLIQKASILEKMPLFGKRIDELQKTTEGFKLLDIQAQCNTLVELLKILGCSASTGDLSKMMPSANQLGKGICSARVSNYPSALLINQSPTGLYEEVIDLKTVEPKE